MKDIVMLMLNIYIMKKVYINWVSVCSIAYLLTLYKNMSNVMSK